FGGGPAARATAAATTTTLTILSGGKAGSTIAPGGVITLTATVTTGAGAVTTGRVKFCDAAAAYCTDVHLLGTEQLTSAGTAELKLIPGIGSHSYKAVFLGTAADAASASGETTLTVSPSATIATTTSIAATGGADTYSLTATVTESGSAVQASGSISFLDTSNGNAALGSATLGQSAATLNWTNALSPAVGSGPYGLAVGDFNGDGLADLAVSNNNDGTVTILLGNGDGTFTQATGSPLKVGHGPVAVVTGDWNGDGNMDLAVANGSDGAVTILLGNGDGTFAEAANSPVAAGKQPHSMVTEDFNGDGIADLAVANYGDGTVTILLGNGDGTFTQTAGGPVAAGMTPYSVAGGDFNGDGVADLAIANGSADTVTILLGKGDGTFTQAANSTVTPGFAPTFVAVGDFNQDGTADLAVVNNGNNAVTILLGNGDGTFTQAADSPVKVGTSPYSLLVGDFNLDGIPDLAVANACGSGPTCSASSYKGTVTVLEGNGDGTFTQAAGSPEPVANWPVSIAGGDFNGDGIPDLAVTNYSSGTVSVLSTQLTETATATASPVAPVGTGTHLVEASYSGDSLYRASTSGTTALNAQTVTPTVTVTPAAASISTAQALSVAIAVSGGNGDPTPTGSVTLTSGSYTSPATALNGGSATIDIPAGSLAVGANTLTAKYSGDNNYDANSGTASVTVTSPSFTVSGSAVTVVRGATTGNTSTITVTPAGGFTGSVVLAASFASGPTGAQDSPTLSFGSTSPVSIAGAAAGTATLTIVTTAATSAALAYPNGAGGRWCVEGGATLACILLFGFAGRRKKWRTILEMLALFAALAVGVLSCGGGTPGTTPGNYVITVTGTSGAITASGTVSITVK
ncbi:MAG TPA: FG-GAP-like repeat-containing protein, partial [Terracidiphilus sp.]|nr:FG-GAP-like repeat-containing protein [Terracidiphilus sp.]